MVTVILLSRMPGSNVSSLRKLRTNSRAPTSRRSEIAIWADQRTLQKKSLSAPGDAATGAFDRIPRLRASHSLCGYCRENETGQAGDGGGEEKDAPVR